MQSMKENSGAGFRRRHLSRAFIWIIFVGSIYLVLVRFFLGGLVPDVEIDKKTGKKRIRRRPERHKKIVNGIEVENTPFDGVLEGHWHLLDIRIPNNGLQHPGGANVDKNAYVNVEADFCVLEWHHQKENAASVPLYHDLRDNSEMCSATAQTFDLYEVAKKAREYDQQTNVTEWASAKHVFHPKGSTPPNAVIFHESRCGSTLLSNLLVSFAPDQSRVYSEARAPMKAIRACESNDDDVNNNDNSQYYTCPDFLHDQLIRDVFYLMGRSTLRQSASMTTANKHQPPPPPRYVFYKMQSTTIYGIDAFARAMPETPWIFLYRDSIEILVSHLMATRTDHHPDHNIGGGMKGLAGRDDGHNSVPICLRDYGKPKSKQPPLLLELVRSKTRTVDSLSREEYCAAHLASLCEAAIRHYQLKQEDDDDEDEDEEEDDGDNEDKEDDEDEKGEEEEEEEEDNNNNSNTGIIVNYNQLPKITWEYLLPDALGIPMSGTGVAKMEQMAGYHSHGSGYQHKPQEWIEDSHSKQYKATMAITDAAALFLNEPYKRLQTISLKQQQQQQQHQNHHHHHHHHERR